MSFLAWVIIIFVILFCWRAIMWGAGLVLGIVMALLGIMLLLGGCATGPVTYEEIELEAYNTREAYMNYDYTVDNEETFKQTVKAMNKAATRLSTFEDNVKRGEILFAYKAQCGKADGMVWWCPRGTPDKPRKNELLHQFVRRYKVERDAQCGCADGSEVAQVLRSMY